MVWNIAINSLAIFDEMWILIFPVIPVPIFFAEFFQWQHCGSFLKKHNSDEWVQSFDIFRRFIICSHLAVGSHHRRRIPRYPHGLQLDRVNVIPTDHMNQPQTLSPPALLLRHLGEPLFCRREACSLVVRFELLLILVRSQALLWAHRSCLSVSLWDRSSIFIAYGDFADVEVWLVFFEAMVLSCPGYSRDVAWT